MLITLPGLHELLAPVIEAAYDRPEPVARCYPGTRQNVIASITNWSDGQGDLPICWLNGPAGFGKSAIAQTMAERYAREGRLAGSFFFRRGIAERSTISRLIPTLSYELALSVPDVKQAIQHVIENEPRIAHRSLRYQFQKLMIEPMLSASNFMGPRKPVVVIDGLDECDDKGLTAEFIEVIISAFKDNSTLPFRIIITSRVEQHIQRKFGTSAACSVVLHKSLHGFDARPDIRVFFKSSFATIYEENRMVMRNVRLPWPSESNLDTLARKSDGSFIFATTLMDVIRKGTGLPQEVAECLDHRGWAR